MMQMIRACVHWEEGKNESLSLVSVSLSANLKPSLCSPEAFQCRATVCLRSKVCILQVSAPAPTKSKGQEQG